MSRSRPITRLRISRVCEQGMLVLDDGRLRNLHAECSGYDDARLGRRYRCQCGCHKRRNAQEASR